MSIQVFIYEKCSTCKKAIEYLDQHKIKYETCSIVNNPPTIEELTRMASFLKKDGKTFKNLFNSSGQQYRELNISKKIKDGMTEKEAFSLLSKNGMLVKRPFLLSSQFGAVGFKIDQWKKLLF